MGCQADIAALRNSILGLWNFEKQVPIFSTLPPVAKFSRFIAFLLPNNFPAFEVPVKYFLKTLNSKKFQNCFVIPSLSDSEGQQTQHKSSKCPDSVS
jgi:hypothetical protein